MSEFDPAMIVWIDETGEMHYGCGIRGIPPASSKRCDILPLEYCRRKVFRMYTSLKEQ